MSKNAKAPSRRATFREDVAEAFLSAIQQGAAPWQKPWKAGVVGNQPFNPKTNAPYRGINSINLDLQGYEDPRWLTLNQGRELGAKLMKGSKSTLVEYWKFEEKQAIRDPDGKPVLGADGKPEQLTIRLERPKVFYAHVFNAERFEGLDPYTPPEPSFDPLERAEGLIAGAGVPVQHDQQDSAYYAIGQDKIHLPPLEAFKDAYGYYATALHELGHATGHPSRLARDYGPFGSETYAKEELRAEIASYLLCRELGLAHDPSQHAGYVQNWMKAIREDKHFIFRAARDAELIRSWVVEPERRQELERGEQRRREADRAPEQNPKVSQERQQMSQPEPEQGAEKRHYLVVSYAERHEAKALGARWDAKAKAWYAPTAEIAAKTQQWQPDVVQAKAPVEKVDPVKEFAVFLRVHGANLDHDPIMDGKWHRVALDGDKRNEKNASYRAFNDERPTGIFNNFKGEQHRWVGTGQELSGVELAAANARMAQARANRELELKEEQDKAAKQAYGIYKNTPWANRSNCEYLKAKGVGGYGLKLDQNGRAIVPIRDGEGRIWNLQFMSQDGKFYMDGGRKQGCMHTIDTEGVLQGKARAEGKVAFVVEGYATGASIHEATKQPVVVAFDKGNLEPVAKEIRERFPQVRLVIASDNDHKLETHPNHMKNEGIEAARKAATSAAAEYITPQLSAAEKARGYTDFNDIHQSRGLDGLKQALVSEMQGLNAQRTQTREKGANPAVERDQCREKSLELAR